MISYMYPCEVPSFTKDIKKCLQKFSCTFYNSVYSNSCTVDFGLSINGDCYTPVKQLHVLYNFIRKKV